MIKIISLILLLSTLSYGLNVQATSQNIRSNLLADKRGYIKVDYTPFSTNSKAYPYGRVTDLNGINLSFGYGIYHYLSIFFDLSYQKIGYASTDLKNRNSELFLKLNIYENPSSLVEIFSADIGLVHNSANSLNISDPALAISKIDDMSDTGVYIRLLTGSKIRSSILDFYFEVRYSDIKTKLDGIDFGRDEFNINGGVQFTLEAGEYIVESGYRYMRIFNRDIENRYKSNHLFNITLGRALNEKLLIFLGINYFTNQYNGVTPHLYNSKSLDSFDQNFGYTRFGFVYNFTPDLNLR